MTQVPPYEPPAVVRFGTFRELTTAGLHGVTDGITVCGTPCPVSPIGDGRS